MGTTNTGRTNMRTQRLGLALATLLALGAPALAGTTKVSPGDDIQDVLANAPDNEKIVFGPGVYEVNVDVVKNGLTLIGKKAVWDGGDRDGDACLRIEGKDITVQGFTFRNGRDCINIEGDGALIRRCTFRGNGSDHIDIDGNDVKIEKCRFRAAFQRAIRVDGNRALIQKNNIKGAVNDDDDDQGAIFVIGSGAVIQRNTIKNVDGRGIVIVGSDSINPPKQGDGGQILRNRVSNTQDDAVRCGFSDDERTDEVVISGNRLYNCNGDLIEVDGHNALIERNNLRNCHREIIDLDGNDAVIQNNKCIDAPQEEGIDVEGHRNKIMNNTVANTRKEGIKSHGDGNEVVGNRVTNAFDNDGIEFKGEEGNTGEGGLVQGNVVSETADAGLSLDVRNATIMGNTFKDVSFICEEPGVRVGGEGGNTLQGNTVIGATGSGFLVEGEGDMLIGNTAKDCLLHGFKIETDGNTLTDCVATGCDAEGLDNQADGTTVTGCTFKKNRIDVANEGTFTNDATFDTDNSFDTGGTSQPSVIGCDQP